MKKLLLVLLFVLPACSSDDDDSSSGDFFENQSGKIWSESYLDSDNASYSYTYYYSISNRKFKTGYPESVYGPPYCTELFIGEINDIPHPNNGWQCNISNQIIVNKANELQIETIVTDPDGALRYTYVVTIKVNGDNLVTSSNEIGVDNSDFEFISAKIYNGNLDLSFNNCDIGYVL